MQYFPRRLRGASLVIGLVAAFATQPLLANGPIGGHVNHLQDHIGEYSEEVNRLVGQVDAMVSAYEAGGKGAVDTSELAEYWEDVNYHAAIETQFVPVYAEIWQGLFAVKGAIDEGQPMAEVRKQQDLLNAALWQGLGAVKLAAQYQQRGLLVEVQTTDTGPTTPVETLGEIKHRLDRVVAKYAEQLSDEALGIVHDTYLHLFEGVEGALIEEDAELVEDLEKDFNVTLPKSIKDGASVDAVRAVVVAMQGKLDQCKALLKAAEDNRKDVF